MSCILRVFGRRFDVDRYLAHSPFQAIAVCRRGEPVFSSTQPDGRKLTHSGCNIEVSRRGFADFHGQVRDAIRFLRKHERTIRALGWIPGVESAGLHFGVVWRDVPAHSDVFSDVLLPGQRPPVCRAERTFEVVDRARSDHSPEVGVPLYEFFDRSQVERALQNDPFLRKSEKDKDSNCVFMLEGFERSFAFHHLQGNQVAVRVGLTHGCEAARGNLTQLGLLLKPKTEFLAELRAAEKAGTLMNRLVGK